VPYPSDPQGNPHTSLVVHVHKNGSLGLPDAYPLGIGVLRIGAGHKPEDYERQIITQLKESPTNPEQIVNVHALVRAVFEATAPARRPSRRASIARRSLPDRTPM